MNLLICDTETTGLFPEQGNLCIEVGALLYNVEHKKVIQTMSTFLPCTENPVEHINHIKAEWTNCKQGFLMAFRWLNEMASTADFIVAHNAEFDKKFLKTIPSINNIFWGRPWICTQKDFPWPVPLNRRRLVDVCEAMKVPYVDAHRSLPDCQFLVDCFNKIDDLEARLSKL